MTRSAALALVLLLAACGTDFGSRAGHVPGTTTAERPEMMPSNAMPQAPGSVPR